MLAKWKYSSSREVCLWIYVHVFYIYIYTELNILLHCFVYSQERSAWQPYYVLGLVTREISSQQMTLKHRRQRLPWWLVYLSSCLDLRFLGYSPLVSFTVLWNSTCYTQKQYSSPSASGHSQQRPPCLIWPKKCCYYYECISSETCVYKDHPRDQQNVVLIHRWSLYAGSITWEVYPWGPVKCGLYKQVVFRRGLIVFLPLTKGFPY